MDVNVGANSTVKQYLTFGNKLCHPMDWVQTHWAAANERSRPGQKAGKNKVSIAELSPVLKAY